MERQQKEQNKSEYFHDRQQHIQFSDEFEHSFLNVSSTLGIANDEL